MAPRPKVDLVRLEIDYCTGMMTNQKLADKYGCGESYVRKKAVEGGWQKDDSQVVRQRINTQLLVNAGNGAKIAPAQQRRTRAEVISEAVDATVSVVMQHRKDLRQLADLRRRLVDKLEAMMPTVDTLPAASIAAGVVDTLGRTLDRVIAGERQAYGLADRETPQDIERGAQQQQVLQVLIQSMSQPGGPDDETRERMRARLAEARGGGK